MNRNETAIACAELMYANDRASRALGIEVSVTEAGTSTATMSIRKDMLNGFDICHGGIVFALADTAFAFACNAYNDLSVAASCQIDFMRPAVLGDELTARAKEDRRDGRHGFYTITITRADGEVVALFRGRSSARSEPLIK